MLSEKDIYCLTLAARQGGSVLLLVTVDNLDLRNWSERLVYLGLLTRTPEDVQYRTLTIPGLRYALTDAGRAAIEPFMKAEN